MQKLKKQWSKQRAKKWSFKRDNRKQRDKGVVEVKEIIEYKQKKDWHILAKIEDLEHN